MGFKEEMKKEMNNVMHDMNIGISKEWQLEHDGYLIVIKNAMKKEELWIDGELADENEHTSIWSHLRPMSKLIGELPNGRKVKVTLGGLTKLTVKVKVDREVIFKEKVKVDLAAGWEGKEAIVPWLREQAATGENITLIDLPDGQFSIVPGEEQIELGYRDYLGYDMPFDSYVKKLMKLLELQVNEQTEAARKATYARIMEEHVRMYGGDLLYTIQESDIDPDKLREEMHWFLENGAHREVIKFALLVLGYLQVEADEEVLAFVGRHEEFTVFAAGGLSQEKLWELARNYVTGWGKVGVMHHLEAFTPADKQWFLQQTFADAKKNHEVALVRADKCEIDELLYQLSVDEEEFHCIAMLIDDLLEPMEADMEEVLLIDDLHKGGEILRLFVEAVEKRQTTAQYESLIEKILAMVRLKLSYVELEGEEANEPGYVDAEYSIVELETIEAKIVSLLGE